MEPQESSEEAIEEQQEKMQPKNYGNMPYWNVRGID